MPNPGCCSCCVALTNAIGFHFDTPPTAVHPQIQVTFHNLPAGCSAITYDGVPVVATLSTYLDETGGAGFSRCAFFWSATLTAGMSLGLSIGISNGAFNDNGCTIRAYIGYRNIFTSAYLDGVATGNTGAGFLTDIIPTGPIPAPIPLLCNFQSVTIGNDAQIGCCVGGTTADVILL